MLNAYTVTQVNSYIKSLLEEDVILQEIFVKGEISNFKDHSSGHLYFSLKDSSSNINCVMFKNSAAELSFKPENGKLVIAFGRISLYEKTGAYQLYIDMLEPAGIGALQVAFEQLKNKLQEEGIFDVEHKKEIPFAPKTVAVITSETGAAVHDVINVIKRRNNNIKIVVIPAIVQGNTASKSIVSAIKLANKWNKADVIILGRGGGSFEDLSCFNEENVARAIFDSKIPIVTGIGHETDFTIADFVSDLRAPTPSAAAELVVPLYDNMVENLEYYKKTIINLINTKINNENRRFLNLIDKRMFKYPKDRVYNEMTFLDTVNKNLEKSIENKLKNKKNQLHNKLELLEAYSPIRHLQKGLTTITNENNVIIKDIDSINIGDNIRFALKNGVVSGKVISKEVDNGKIG